MTGGSPERTGTSDVTAPGSYSRAVTSTSNYPAARSYRLGRLPFTLSGDGECASYLQAELAALRESESYEKTSPAPFVPRLAFDFVHALPPLRDYTATTPVYAMEDSFRVSYNSLNYHVSRLEGVVSGAARPDGSAPATAVFENDSATSVTESRGSYPNPEPCLLNPAGLRIALRPDDFGRRHRWFSTLYRARDWNFLSGEETHAKNFMYGVFDYFTHIAQLELGQSYIHASSLSRDGEGTAIVAWGGIGKTSAALKLITEHGFNFLSDDLGLVDDSGTIWRTPKRLQVYAYNLEGEEQLRSMLLDGRSILDRASWEWKLQRRGPKGVRRRVSAEELFGAQSVARSAPLTRVFCLERGDAHDFEVRPITTEELSHRAAEVVMHEIEPFGLVSRALHSGHHAPLLPTQDQVVSATRAVLRRAFADIPVLSIRIPLSTTPTTLANYLLSLIEK
ncbi:MAG TPA: hypothetical protein VFK04_02465 [Gemmatimonadaceae bacterium]|nr:hypothetical protein [Gemmatimonadaceae bacterium]